MAKADVLTPQATDFPQWYQDILAKAELAEGGPVRGTIVIRPYGYAIWERMQAEIDARIKAAGAQNAYFPLFIPESYFRREAEHVEGFSPELAVVTHGGGKKLEEPIVVRPTSETIIDSFLAKWIQSYRDLPLLLNQWANVVRWELRPRLFLRTTEFLWQEGHTAHATEKDAHEYALRILRDVYEDFMVNVLAIPVVVGRKTDQERFAGATTTWSTEAMMRDGKALQMGTSHELGQGFARAFDISFLDQSGQKSFVWQTSWGASTRLMGALIMAHGDDAGLVMPPRVAPIQVVVVPVTRSNDPEGSAAVEEACQSVEAEAGEVRLRVDRREGIRPGEKYAHWELRGVPLRITVGARDLAAGQVTLTRRVDGESWTEPLEGVGTRLAAHLDEAQTRLRARAQTMLEERTVEVESLAALRAAFEARPVFANAPFCARPECEEAVKAASHALTVRVLRRDRSGEAGRCLACGEASSEVALIARAY